MARPSKWCQNKNGAKSNDALWAEKVSFNSNTFSKAAKGRTNDSSHKYTNMILRLDRITVCFGGLKS